MQKPLASLQLLRFAAAFAVIVCHSRSLYQHIAGGEDYSRIVEHGAIGVPVFFVISGFVIFGAAHRATNPIAFLGRRLARIYPPLWAAVAILLPVLWLFDDLAWVTPLELFHSLTLIDLSPSGDGNVLFVAWTLSYELLFYLTVTLLLTMPIWLRRPTAIGLVGALILTTYALPTWVPPLFANPMTFCFVFGVLAAASDIPRNAPGALIAAAFGLWVIGFASGAESEATLTALFFGGGAALLLAALKTEDLQGTVASFARWLGDASYALYLTHPVVLIFLLASGLDVEIAGAISPGGLIAVFLLTALAIGAFFHVVVERRGSRLVKRISADLAIGLRRRSVA